jgi:hypothetical protein
MKTFYRAPAALCAALVILAFSSVPPTSGQANAADSLGPVVLTRAHGDALAVWDATTDLATLVNAKSSAEETLRRLESDALTVLIQKAKVLAPDAKTLTVQTIYQRTGAVSPTYQVATFAGIERLFTIKAAVGGTEATNGAGWVQQLKAGKVPDGVTVVVTGKLPPELH